MFVRFPASTSERVDRFSRNLVSILCYSRLSEHDASTTAFSDNNIMMDSKCIYEVGAAQTSLNNQVPK
jgi:hypothetical protein